MVDRWMVFSLFSSQDYFQRFLWFIVRGHCSRTILSFLKNIHISQKKLIISSILKGKIKNARSSSKKTFKTSRDGSNKNVNISASITSLEVVMERRMLQMGKVMVILTKIINEYFDANNYFDPDCYV